MRPQNRAKSAGWILAANTAITGGAQTPWVNAAEGRQKYAGSVSQMPPRNTAKGWQKHPGLEAQTPLRNVNLVQGVCIFGETGLQGNGRLFLV